MAVKNGGVPIHLNKDMFIYNDTVSEKLFLACFDTPYTCTVNPLYNDRRYNSKIRYNVYSVCTKSADRAFFHLYSHVILQKKHTFCVFVRGDSNKHTKHMIYKINCSKVSVIHASEGPHQVSV